jgi:hypothetical protein
MTMVILLKKTIKLKVISIKKYLEKLLWKETKRKSCLGTIYEDFSKYLSPEEPRAIYEDFSKYLSSEEPCAIYEDFSKYLSPEEPRVTYRKENSRTSFFQVGVSDVGRNLLIFSMKTKIENRKNVQNNTEAAPFN